jgi:hypothetical protein
VLVALLRVILLLLLLAVAVLVHFMELAVLVALLPEVIVQRVVVVEWVVLVEHLVLTLAVQGVAVQALETPAALQAQLLLTAVVVELLELVEMELQAQL